MLALAIQSPPTSRLMGGQLSPSFFTSSQDTISREVIDHDLGEGPSHRRRDSWPPSSQSTYKQTGATDSAHEFLPSSGHGTKLQGERKPQHGGVRDMSSNGTIKSKLWDDLLKDPPEFVDGGVATAQDHVPYEPINVPPHPGQGKGVLLDAIGSSLDSGLNAHDQGDQSASCDIRTGKNLVGPDHGEITCPSKISAARKHETSKRGSMTSLGYATPISAQWLRNVPIGPGFHNEGNTCFLNATLQSLVHTPPLYHALLDRKEHSSMDCVLRRQDRFCALCGMSELVKSSATCRRSVYPHPISKYLRKFAPTMRLGRQEDAHEFLRFLIDAMQNAALNGKADKAKQSDKESTLIHRMFGGRLRSRVTCEHCDHHSDTYDAFLDLSLDIREAQTVQQALKLFRRFDKLTGPNKYKCEHCKGFRDARKAFTIDTVPPILTLHLKRFTAGGKKMNRSVGFEEHLDVSVAMSQASTQAHYKLYAVINHAGGSNHSGHYYSYVKSSDGQWYEMNDSSVHPCHRGSTTVCGAHNAYILLYARDKGDELAEAINGIGLGKRKDREDDARSVSSATSAVTGTPLHSTKKANFIGPLRPTTTALSQSIPAPPVVSQVSTTSAPTTSTSTSPQALSEGLQTYKLRTAGEAEAAKRKREAARMALIERVAAKDKGSRGKTDDADKAGTEDAAPRQQLPGRSGKQQGLGVGRMVSG